MSHDTLVDEVRAIRDAYAKRFNYDLDAIVADLREKAASRGTKLVTLPPRLLPPVDPASRAAAAVEPKRASIKG